MAVIHAEDEADAPTGIRIAKPRAINRGSLPKHLPQVEEDRAGKLDSASAAVAFIALGRMPPSGRMSSRRVPSYCHLPSQICVPCLHRRRRSGPGSSAVDPGRTTDGSDRRPCAGLQHADHLPLYRQAQIMSRQGIDLDCSTLADWVGRAVARIAPRLRCADCRPEALDQAAVHGRDPCSGPRLPARARPKLDTSGRWRGMTDRGRRCLARRRLHLYAWSRGHSCRTDIARLLRHPAGRWLCRIQQVDRS